MKKNEKKLISRNNSKKFLTLHVYVISVTKKCFDDASNAINISAFN